MRTVRRFVAQYRGGHGLAALATLVALLSACGRAEEESSPAESQESALRVAEEVETDASGALEREQGNPLPAPLARTYGEGGANVGVAGGTIVAGDCRLELPRSSSRASGVVSIWCFAPDEVRDYRPPGLILAAGNSRPSLVTTGGVAKLYVPLAFDMSDVEADIEFELLTWMDEMNAWTTSSYGELQSDGETVLFYADRVGEFVVRARPIWDESRMERCAGDTFNLGEQSPEDEADCVGVTEEGQSLPRETAFAALTDLRAMDLPDWLIFKNEEIVDKSGRIQADERDHKDEDFLLDAGAAESLVRLTDLVGQEWRTYFTDEPAYRLRVTEAYDSLGEHRDVSTHYQGRGLDLTLEPVPRVALATRRAYYGRLTRLAACAGFGYVFFENRYHVHVATAPTRVALLVAEQDSWSVWIYAPSNPSPPARIYRGQGANPSEISALDAETIELITEGVVRARLSIGGTFVPSTENEQPTAPRERAGGHVLRVIDGMAWLASATAGPPLGSTNADGEPVGHRAPLAITFEGVNHSVVDAVFMPASSE